MNTSTMPTSKRTTVETASVADVKTESPTSTRQTRSQTKELISALENLDIKQVDRLIFDLGFDPSVMSAEQLTRSLWHAVKMQNVPLVRELLKHQPKLKSDEQPMLMLALKQLNAEIAGMLLEAGADVNEADYLHAVVSCEDPKVRALAVPLMERGADLAARDSLNRSVLCCAVESAEVGIVEELLRRGVKISNDEYKAVLAQAINGPRAAELLELLFRCECFDVEKRDRLTLTIIFNLIEYEPHRVDTVKMLLGVGVPVDQANESGITALHYAVNLNRVEIAELLLTHGADVNKKTNRGTTPVMLAARLCEPKIASMLVERGANIHDCNISCRYPIHFACEHGDSRTIRLLIGLGANVDVVDQLDFTPLSLLRDSSHEKTDMLIKHFAFLAANGISFNSTDLATIRSDRYMSSAYELCLKELRRMKENEFMSGVTYFDLLNSKIERLTLLTKTKEVVEQFHKHQKNANGKSFRWLKYSRELSVAFRMAEKRRDSLILKKTLVRDAFDDFLPQVVLDKIARYLLDDFKSFKKNFYLSQFST